MASIDSLWLSMVPGVGPQLYQRLLQHFQTPTGVLAASEGELSKVPGLGKKTARLIRDARWEIDAQQQWDDCQRYGIRIIDGFDDQYPIELKEIPDPPPVLYCRGQWQSSDRLAIAVVGSRRPSPYGLRMASQFARGLTAAGFVVVSGMARGIDAAAHRAALEAGGRTLAVLGSGLMNLYPTEHQQLANEISESGLVISEVPPHVAPHSGAFPRRNRLVSGLSLGVLVVEAGSRSGALITARHASEQGREVFAIPGRIDERNSQGCHALIRDGATLVQCLDDLLDELGPLAQPVVKPPTSCGNPSHPMTVETVRQPSELKLSQQETNILNAIESQPTLIDHVVQSTELPVQRVLATISVLQSRRLIRRISGNHVCRV